MGDGDINSPLMIIGETPGKIEDGFGHSFQGDVGILLKKIQDWTFGLKKDAQNFPLKANSINSIVSKPRKKLKSITLSIIGSLLFKVNFKFL